MTTKPHQNKAKRPQVMCVTRSNLNLLHTPVECISLKSSVISSSTNDLSTYSSPALPINDLSSDSSYVFTKPMDHNTIGLDQNNLTAFQNQTSTVSSTKCTKPMDYSINKCVKIQSDVVSQPIAHQVSHFTVPCTNLNNNNSPITNPPATGSVVNLSKLTLTPPMVSLLSKGLNFCPTPGELDISNLRRDLDKFHVSLRRKLFFSKRVDSPSSLDLTTISQSSTQLRDDNEPFKHPKFKNPSSWCPLAPPQLEAMIVVNENNLTNYTPRAPRLPNVTPEEKQALAELKSNQDIKI